MIDVITVAATSTLVLQQNELRERVVLTNNSDEDMYVAPGPAAVATAGYPLKAAGGSFSDQPDSRGWIYTGPYMAICASGGKLLSVVEHNNGH